jgi:ethanolamine utilization protein EutJ
MTSAIEHLDRIVNQPQNWDFSGAGCLYAGVDIGTYKTIAVVVDEKGFPRAASMRKAAVVQSGLIVDYIGALKLVREIMEEIRSRSPLPVDRGATSFPPRTESANIKTTRYILEGAGLEVLRVLDEPSAAKRVLDLNDGAIVDVGGGTTGVAIVKDGEIVHTNDEATGGVHFSLVLAGSLNISYEEAEAYKADRDHRRDIIPIVRPVIDKIATIVEQDIRPYENVGTVWMVGGTCALDGMADIVGDHLQKETLRPEAPQMITPFGIALSCLEAGGSGSGERIADHAIH